MRMDEHFAPQSYFIHGLPHDKIDFFMLNNNILTDIKNHYNMDIDDTLHKNGTGNFVHITLNNDEFIKRIYADDYALIKNVSFINKV